MSDILNKIVAHKKNEIELLKANYDHKTIENGPFFNRQCNSLKKRLSDSSSSGVIAEFKRKSPSKSAINLNANVSEVTKGYSIGGASAISILTDEHFFGGNLHHLLEARQGLPSMPLLRKEFILDEIQILQSKSAGADMILLIAEILTKKEISQLTQFAKSLGLEVLLELHSSVHLDKIDPDVSFIGVNNRDLKSFELDFERSIKLSNLLPKEMLKIAESGLSKTESLIHLFQNGFRGFLIGELFMKSEDPGRACKVFIDEYIQKRINIIS